MITDALKQVLSSQLPGYSKPKSFTVEDVDILFKPHKGVSMSGWRSFLESWLPAFDSVGWTEELNAIHIGKDACEQGKAATYWPGLIGIQADLPTDPNDGAGQSYVVEISRRTTLCHEMIHHAHNTLGDASYGGITPEDVDKQHLIRTEVSEYATTNINEAIAEIGAGIIIGHNFPQEIHDFYEEWDGPEGAYALRESR